MLRCLSLRRHQIETSMVAAFTAASHIALVPWCCHRTHGRDQSITAANCSIFPPPPFPASSELNDWTCNFDAGWGSVMSASSSRVLCVASALMKPPTRRTFWWRKPTTSVDDAVTPLWKAYPRSAGEHVAECPIAVHLLRCHDDVRLGTIAPWPRRWLSTTSRRAEGELIFPLSMNPIPRGRIISQGVSMSCKQPA